MKNLYEIDSTLKEKFKDVLCENKTLRLTYKYEQEFNDATKCCFCNEELKDDRVRDHNHFTGKYFGAAHAKCNKKSKDAAKNRKIPCFFIILITTSNNYFVHMKH